MIETTNYSSKFRDKRLERRGMQLLRSLFRSGQSSLQSIAESRAEQKGYYRLLRHDKVSEETLIEEMTQRCGRLCQDKVVLSIQDSSEINLSRHRGRLRPEESIGPTHDSYAGLGFHIHPSLVVDAYSYYPYGYSGIEVWARPVNQQKVTPYQDRCLEVKQKETQVWLQSNEATYRSLASAQAVIIVQDREGDFYEQLSEVPPHETFYFLIRSRHNRHLQEGVRLWDRLAQQPVLGTYTTRVSTQQKGKPAATRDARIEVKALPVVLPKPVKKKGTMPAFSRPLTVVEAREVQADKGVEPVLWRLYTTWPVADFADARQVIEWYGCRWLVEEVFKVLKKECYDVEASELESGWAIRKLTLMLLDTIIKLFQMAIAYDTPEEEMPDTVTVFEEKEIQCLEQINQRLQGKTTKLSNPFMNTKLAWAFWILSRLGGWKGYQSQRKPGFATLLHGLKTFYAIYQGYAFEKDVGTQ